MKFREKDFYIKFFSIKEIEEIYDIREWLEGIDILGPKYFGFNFDYIPIEKLV